MILTPFIPDAFAPVRATLRASLTNLQVHLLDALRANASGAPEHRADGSVWRAVSLADADLDGFGDRACRHFSALRAAGPFGPFEPVGIAGGRVLISHAAEVRP